MKDYTKYDFAAIVGAEVTIECGDDDPYTGIVLGLCENKPIILLKTDSIWYNAGDAITQNPRDILSLSAKIKVEDMTIKQTRNLQNGKSTFNGNEVLDCTDWGWKE